MKCPTHVTQNGENALFQSANINLSSYLTGGRRGSEADVIMLLMSALHDMRGDRASSSGKCEPKECQGF